MVAIYHEGSLIVQQTNDRNMLSSGWNGTRLIAAALAVLLLGACATAPKGQTYDPLEKVNRVTFKFNDFVDKLVLKPLSQGYVAIVPRQGRKMVSNFFDNAAYMNTVLNDFLQGKGKQGSADFGRFLLNSTVGIGGLFDPATKAGLVKHNEDFGQTLAVWGAPQGAYLVLPVYGPNTVRDVPDLASSTLTSGLFWAGYFVLAPEVTIPLGILSAADLRSRASNALRFVNESALDPYVFTREAWIQHRNYLIYDGHPPMNEDEFSDQGFDQ